MSAGLMDIDKAVYDRLTGDTTLTAMLGSATAVYKTLAPEEPPYPIVIFATAMPAQDDHVLTGRYLTIAHYDIKGVVSGYGGEATGGLIAKRIDQLLEDAPLTLAEGVLFYLRRSATFSYSEMVENTPIAHVGGTYDIEVTP